MFPRLNTQGFSLLHLPDLTFYLQDIGFLRWLHAQKAHGLVDTQDNYWTEAQYCTPRLLLGSEEDTVRYRPPCFWKVFKLHITYWQIPLPKVHFWGPKNVMMHLHFISNDRSSNVRTRFSQIFVCSVDYKSFLNKLMHLIRG